MKASILDLRRRMPDVLAALDRHEQVTILHRGRPRAVLVPAGDPVRRRGSAQGHAAFGMWKDRDDLDDVPATVRRLRQPRRHAL